MALWTDPLAWFVLGLFGAATLGECRGRHLARRFGVWAWIAFAGFWLLLVPHFAMVRRSIVLSLGTVVAVPACLAVGYALYRGRDSLFVLTRAVTVMAAVYLVVTTVPWLLRLLIETTTWQTETVIELLGYRPDVRSYGGEIRNYLLITDGANAYATMVILSCTGLASIAVFLGLIAAVEAPFDRKLRAVAVSVPVIWVLNLLRTSFITLAHGKQWFRGVGTELVFALFRTSDADVVSYLIADRVISETLSVVVFLIVFWLVVRELPELEVVVEDMLYVATRSEYDARAVLPRYEVGADRGRSTRGRADGSRTVGVRTIGRRADGGAVGGRAADGRAVGSEETGGERVRSGDPPGRREPGRREPGRREPGRREPGRREPGRRSGLSTGRGGGGSGSGETPRPTVCRVQQYAASGALFVFGFVLCPSRELVRERIP